MDLHLEQRKQEIAALERTSVSSQDYRRKLIALLRKTVAFDAYCCTSVDPGTLLSTGAVTEDGIEAIHPQLFENEYSQEDYNKYADLAQAPAKAATLSDSTGGRLERSTRYRDILRPAGFQDELRAALVCDRSCWGYLTLFRSRRHPLFSEADCSFVASVAPLIARALRAKHVSAFGIIPDADTQEPGILLMSDRLTPLVANQAAEHWVTKLRAWEQTDHRTLPRPIRAICTLAKAALASDTRKTLPSKVCVPMPDGQFLNIRASWLNGEAAPASGQLAVWFEPARPADIWPLITEAYGLSAREKQIVGKVLRGLSTKELAGELHISEYTVQDHLKSIFAKTGASSRRELVWRLYARFSLPESGQVRSAPDDEMCL